MSTPVITTRPDWDRSCREQVRRPDWSALPAGKGSNTAGAGVAFLPPARTLESRERIARGPERAFEARGWWWRTRRRTAMVLRSPGVVMLGGLSCLLMIGLSPLLTDPGQVEQPPVPVISGPATAGDAMDTGGAGAAVPGTAQPGQ